MTGFARNEGAMFDGMLTWVWELRSVNGKGLDMRLRLPSGFEGLEPQIRQETSNNVARGNLNIALSISSSTTEESYRINEAVLDNLIAMAAKKAKVLPDGVGPATLDGLMAVKGVVETSDPGAQKEEERNVRDAALLSGLRKALAALLEARSDEGRHLTTLLRNQLFEIEKLTNAAQGCAAMQPDALKMRLKSQIEALLESTNALPEERLAQEAAILATKADVTEELDRLHGHVGQGRALLEIGSPCGRKLEFLSQEFNREANTLCSKSTDPDLTKIGLDIKAVIDQFREQIQNVE